MVVARENPAAQSNKEDGKVFVRNNQIVMRVNANEIVHKTGFFPGSECKIDDGLIIDFKDGRVTARTKDDGLMGAYVGRGAMTFHLGNESCQITVQIRRRNDRE